jgi:hypothetical protein
LVCLSRRAAQSLDAYVNGKRPNSHDLRHVLRRTQSVAIADNKAEGKCQATGEVGLIGSPTTEAPLKPRGVMQQQLSLTSHTKSAGAPATCKGFVQSWLT